jgi:Tc5 transposase DNA-binding domain.
LNNLAGVNIQKMKGTKHEELEEALAIWVEQLHVKNGTATEEIIQERAKMMCKLCALVPS